MESEFSIEAATQFSAVAGVVADIVQRGVEAFQRLAEAIRSLPVPLSHTRHAMRARKIGRVLRGISYS